MNKRLSKTEPTGYKFVDNTGRHINATKYILIYYYKKKTIDIYNLVVYEKNKQMMFRINELPERLLENTIESNQTNQTNNKNNIENQNQIEKKVKIKLKKTKKKTSKKKTSKKKTSKKKIKKIKIKKRKIKIKKRT